MLGCIELDVYYTQYYYDYNYSKYLNVILLDI